MMTYDGFMHFKACLENMSIHLQVREVAMSMGRLDLRWNGTAIMALQEVNVYESA
mgnify:CR=1 FL=1